VRLYRLAPAGGQAPVSLTGLLGEATSPDWWVPAEPASADAGDRREPTVIVFSGPPVASSSVRAHAAVTRLRAATPTRTIITTRARLRFDVVDRSGIARFQIVLKPHYPHGRCRRTANDLGAPVRCTGAESLEARSAGGLRALRRRLRPGTYDLFAHTADVLGNHTKFAVRGRLRLTR
jgi:hypothetical protein